MKNNRALYLIVSILCIWCLFLSVNVINNQDNKTEHINEYNVSGFSTDYTKVIETVKPSVVTIKTDKSLSSGFVYAQQDDFTYIVASAHGVIDSSEIKIIFANNLSFDGKVLDYDQYLDLAVIETNVPYTINCLKLSDSSLLKQGEFVVSIGTPTSLEYAGSIEMGMVSNNLLTIDNSIAIENIIYNYYLDVIQTSSNLKNGYSGSPLINMSGEVIGMNTMSNTTNNTFAITSNELKLVADSIISGFKLNKKQLGIIGSYICDMQNYEKSSLNLSIDIINGLYIDKLREGSPSLKFGLKVGDIITSINDISIINIDDYNDAIYNCGEEININIIRNNEPLTISGNFND